MSAYRSPRSCRRRVEPSMSVKRKVTVPAGKSRTLQGLRAVAVIPSTNGGPKPGRRPKEPRGSVPVATNDNAYSGKSERHSTVTKPSLIGPYRARARPLLKRPWKQGLFVYRSDAAGENFCPTFA